MITLDVGKQPQQPRGGGGGGNNQSITPTYAKLNLKPDISRPLVLL
jgi:hypothetical protein